MPPIGVEGSAGMAGCTCWFQRPCGVLTWQPSLTRPLHAMAACEVATTVSPTLHSLLIRLYLLTHPPLPAPLQAMAACEVATTVSPTYAEEISGHPAIAPHHSKFRGIRNGIDPDIWDPAGGWVGVGGWASQGPCKTPTQTLN